MDGDFCKLMSNPVGLLPPGVAEELTIIWQQPVCRLLH